MPMCKNKKRYINPILKERVGKHTDTGGLTLASFLVLLSDMASRLMGRPAQVDGVAGFAWSGPK